MIKSLSVIFPMYNESNRLFRTFRDIEKFEKQKIKYIQIKDIEITYL